MRVSHDELDLQIRFGLRFDSASIVALEGNTLHLNLFGEIVKAQVPRGAPSAHARSMLACRQTIGRRLNYRGAPHDLVPAGRGNIRHKAGIEIVDDS